MGVRGALFESDAGLLVCACCLEVPEEAGGGGFGGEASVADVGEAVAVGVGAGGVGRPGDVGAHAVG